MHQVPLAYMAVFRKASLEPGPSLTDPELSAHLTRPLQALFYLMENNVMTISCINFSEDLFMKKDIF